MEKQHQVYKLSENLVAIPRDHPGGEECSRAFRAYQLPFARITERNYLGDRKCVSKAGTEVNRVPPLHGTQAAAL